MGDELSRDLKIAGTGGQDVHIGKPSNNLRNTIIGVISFACVIGLYFLYANLGGYVSADSFFEQSRVRTGLVTRGDFERSISVEGSVVATSSPTLYAQDTGEIHLIVVAGDPVREGQLLAVIDNPELASRLKREQASLELVKVELETLKNQIKQQELNDVQSLTLLKIKREAAGRELDRMSKVVNAGTISENDFEKIKDEMHALEVQVDNAEEQNVLTKENHTFELRTKSLNIAQQALLVNDLQRQVDELHVKSPVDGVVGDIKVKERDTVTPKQPILNVVDLTSYELEVLIPETYAESLRKRLRVRVSYREAEISAFLSSISPQVQQGSVAARVVFDGTAPSGLRENLRLNNKIILESKQDVLKVKRGPFVESHGGRGAYVMQDNDPAASIASYKKVELGSVGVNEVEIISGLQEGDLVIISNTAELAGAASVLLTN